MKQSILSSRVATRAFSLVEILVVVMIIGILAAIVVPNFATAADGARSSALESAAGGVRSSIAAFRTRAVLEGNDPFPTLGELTTEGTVLQGPIPENPYSGLTTVQSVSQSAASNRTVSNSSTYGWNYYVDNSVTPPAAVFYANSTDATEVSDGAGGTLQANEV